MANDITSNQNSNLDWLDGTASAVEKIDFKGVDKILLKRAKLLVTNLVKSINKKKVNLTGDMENNIKFFLKDETDGSRSLNVEMVDYAKFVDKGVKGWDNSRNAPNSPYQYKTKGMPKDGIARIKRMIESGTKKTSVSDIKKYGAVGYEKKNQGGKKSLIDKQTAQAVWMIKKYGIKTKNFIKEPVDISFKGMEVEISDELGIQIVAKILKQ